MWLWHFLVMLSYVLGLNTDWNHTLVMVDGVDLVRKSSSAMNVFPFAFRDDMPLLSCFVCLSKYSFLV